ncbi:hypothetical protein FVEG_15077 [Fusarium verticillioides 7600]|uniref:Uncharacterized protein n=1 Tax=Gibberella moniliformis (strain M3125 / FGSC 7600) TaxID=334819 RepID=W7M4K2_GIBM7|nr:hypothetical protein FVEG_15077 [Fusarium verticillioides 7600]EWG39852.1 hypothetical protein FVEG_15077 [Fusarium verticillioides 7600]
MPVAFTRGHLASKWELKAASKVFLPVCGCGMEAISTQGCVVSRLLGSPQIHHVIIDNANHSSPQRQEHRAPLISAIRQSLITYERIRPRRSYSRSRFSRLPWAVPKCAASQKRWQQFSSSPLKIWPDI